MFVKMQRLWRTFSFPDLENVCAGRIQDALLHQLLHGPLTLVVRVDLHQRLRPVAALRVLMFYLGLDIGCGDTNETAGKATIAFDELVAELENVIHKDSSLIHLAASRQNRRTTGGACRDALPFRPTPFAGRFDQTL